MTRGRVLRVRSFGEQLEPVHARHPDVEQQQIEAPLPQRLQRLDPSFATDVVKPALVSTFLSTCRVARSSSTTRIFS